MRRSVYALIGTVAGTTLLIGAKLATPDSDSGTDSHADGGPVAPAPAIGAGSQPASALAGEPAGGLRDGTHTGTSITDRYGTVTVAVVVSGGRVSDVRANYDTRDPRSRRIGEGAAPRLREEALTAQSADIATVSGATYYSRSYTSSLQAALDAARA